MGTTLVQLSDCPRDLHRTELQLTVAFKLQGSDYSFPIVANFIEKSAIPPKPALPVPSVKKIVYTEIARELPDFDFDIKQSRMHSDPVPTTKEIPELYRWQFVAE